MPENLGVLAIDIGGTKMEAAWVDPTGQLAARNRVETPVGEAEHVWHALVSAVDLTIAEAPGPVGAVGVGCGGPMVRGGELVSPLNIAGWRDFPLRSRLIEHLGESRVYIENDAKALALAEGWLGAAAGLDDYLAMVVSTGVGGGIVSDGRLLHGADGNAGHIGHVIVVPDGRRCACGARGCLEAEASGTAIAEIIGRPAAEADDDMRERTGRLVGRAVASVANLLDLRLAAVAGSVALGFGAPFFDAAQAELAASARLDFSAGAVIVPGGCGDAGPLIGAAAVALGHAPEARLPEVTDR